MSALSDYKMNYEPITIRHWYGMWASEDNARLLSWCLIKSADYLDYVSGRAHRASKELRRLERWW